MPAGPDDPVVERVVWALQDPVAAKALADEPPNRGWRRNFRRWRNGLIYSPKQDCWAVLSMTSKRVLQIRDAGIVRLVDNGLGPQDPYNLDATRRHISQIWLARHLHVPQLLAWVLQNGGHLHPYLRWEVQGKAGGQELRDSCATSASLDRSAE